LGPTTHTQALFYYGAWHCVLLTGPADIILLTLGATVLQVVSVGTNDPHPGIIYCGAWRRVLPTRPADFILLTLGATILQVWEHDMLTPATGFRLMCGMTQCPSPPQALT
jgi:hypothetical protein